MSKGTVSSNLTASANIGELAELGLRQRFAKLSLRKRRIGSNPILSAKLMHKYQSGLMAQSAKLSIREFKSHHVLQKLVI